MGKNELKKRLIRLVLDRTFRFSEKPVFKLASGQTSNFYFNCKPTTLNPEGMYLIGNLLYDLVKTEPSWNLQAAGGLTLGADPLATALAYTSYIEGSPLEAFIVRKGPKKHGTMAWIEGNVKEGDNVLIVEDVITTGGSTLKAVTRSRESGLHVAGVVVLIDRQEGGRERVTSLGLPFYALLTKEEIFTAYQSVQGAAPNL